MNIDWSDVIFFIFLFTFGFWAVRGAWEDMGKDD
jgi:hypothetical protein